MTDTVKLEPCPFCGKQPILYMGTWAQCPSDLCAGRVGAYVLPGLTPSWNTRPAPKPAPDRVCVCGHSKADHSEKHGWECSEECTCLKYTPAPDRDAVRVHEMAEALAASHSRLVKVHAALTALCGPDADWWGETEGYCPACGEKVGNELPCHDDAHAPDCLFIKGRKALTPSHPSAGRDEVREALLAQFRYRMPDGTPCNCDAHIFADELPASKHGKACSLGRKALATPQGKEDAS